MAKRFYLATQKDSSEKAAPLLEGLKAQGWERTYAWSSQDNVSPGEYAKIAVLELAGVREADVLVVLLPGGFGTHVEIGAALALGKPVILHASDLETLKKPYPCIFHSHPGVKLLVSQEVNVNEIIASMLAGPI
jgi:nucleoside 2-deoxyribosyltransferase